MLHACGIRVIADAIIEKCGYCDSQYNWVIVIRC